MFIILILVVSTYPDDNRHYKSNVSCIMFEGSL